MSDSNPFSITISPALGNSLLAQTAAALSPGYSIKLNTTLLGSTLVYGSEVENFIKWGMSAYYDPTRREIGFIGKRASTYPYHWLVYDEDASEPNAWSNSREVDSSFGTTGHGYDHNTVDPATGTVYHRPFNSKIVYAWNGAWSALPAWTPNAGVVGGLTWFPGVGLMFNEGPYLLRYPIGGPSWETVSGNVQPFPTYYDFSEYNSTANIMIFGGGTESNTPWRRGSYFKWSPTSGVQPIQDPTSFTIDSSETQSICVSDPSSANFIAWDRRGTWKYYNVASDSWLPLSQSSGSGATQQIGTPALTTNFMENPTICCSIPDYGVMMFIQFRGAGATQSDVWLYKGNF